MKPEEIVGKIFGRLTVLERAENKGKHTCWRCRCACGVECVVSSTHLISRHSCSCGCIRAENIAALNISHKMEGTRIYSAWLCIKQRCFNSNNKGYKYYGGRGISMFADWIDNFVAFYEYVSKLEHYNEPNYSLDRIDNNGDYEPGNLRFADRKTQCRNRRTNIIIEYEGETMTLIESSEKSGIPYGTLISRIRRGDRNERLFRPVKKC